MYLSTSIENDFNTGHQFGISILFFIQNGWPTFHFDRISVCWNSTKPWFVLNKSSKYTLCSLFAVRFHIIHWHYISFVAQNLKNAAHGVRNIRRAPGPDLNVKGRLLTIDEGCGLSKKPIRRIVGGAPAKKYAWPWVALLGQSNSSGITFKCGKKRKT